MGSPVAGAEGQQGAQQQGGEQQQAATAPDFSPVMDRVGQLEAVITPVAEWVQAQQQQQAQGPEQSYEDFVASLFAGDDEQQPGEVAQQQAQQQAVPPVFQDPQLFAQLVDRAVERRMQESVTPEVESLREERFQRDVNDLLERYPALQEQANAQEVVVAAQQFAHEIGQPELWRSPRVIEMVYRSQLAGEQAAAEVPADANGGATLEGANGGNPGSQEPGLAQQLIQAHNGAPAGDVRWW